MEIEQLSSILNEAGCQVENHHFYLKCNAVYRDGRDISSVTIYPDTNMVIDHVIDKRFTIKEFLKALTNKDFEIEPVKFLDVGRLEFFDTNIIENLKQDHTYWTNRRISLETLSQFKGGVCESGNLKNRYVFPVFNCRNQIIGLVGRDLTDKAKNKYKIKGKKSNFVYPAFLNLKDILKPKTVILVEGVGCVLSLWECGIKTAISLFGVELSSRLLGFLLKVNPKKIIIATNNEDSEIGNRAAEKIKGRLLRHFNRKRILIKLPYCKDFNKMLVDNGKRSISEWWDN